MLGQRPSSRQIDAWFWRETFAAKLLQVMRVHGMASDNNALKTVNSRFLVPAPLVAAQADPKSRLLEVKRHASMVAGQEQVPSMTESDFAVWNEENFDAEVLRQSGLAVVDFWSEGCVPCKRLTRVLTQLADEIPQNVRIGTVKVNDNPELAERFGVQGAPTLLFFKDGALVDTRTGVDRRQVLKKLVEIHA